MTEISIYYGLIAVNKINNKNIQSKTLMYITAIKTNSANYSVKQLVEITRAREFTKNSF